MDFEWDDDKAASNLDKHGLSFEAALGVFLDPERLDMRDDRFDDGEERRIAIGRVDGLCVTIAYTMRGATARIISARRASRKERIRYDRRP